MFFILASLTVFIGIIWITRTHYSKLPPGPPPLPIIGNLHQLSPKATARKFQEWHQKYGPIIAVRLGPNTVISIGSHQVARELLTQRSQIYSSRPRFPIMDECIFRGLSTVLLPYGPLYRQHQRIQWNFLKPSVAKQYRSVQDVESKQLLHELLSDNNFHALFVRLAYSLNSTLAYSKRVESVDADTIKIMAGVSKAVAAISQSPCGSLVELLPALNRLPAWLAPWKRQGALAFERVNALYEQNRADGEASPAWNWIKRAAGLKEVDGLSHEEITHIIGFIFEVGGEVVSGVLEVFILAAITFPEAMTKAREEIDAVVGSDRLPTFDDLEQLPYTCAVFTETLRWRPLVPMGFPHMVTENDEYMGFQIPKGMTILPNHWTMDLDGSIFDHPTEFRPQRWLDNPDLPIAAYGFGRRVCAGRYIGKDTLRIVICRLLWAFDIVPGHSSDENKITIDPWDMAPGLLGPPATFPAQFLPWSPRHQQIIEQEWTDVEKDPNNYINDINA